MKTVKLIMVSLCLFIGLISCSSGDDNDNLSTTSNTTMDKLTDGVWYLQHQSQRTMDFCDRNTSYKYNVDNTLIVQVYYEDFQEVCQHQDEGNFVYEIVSDNTQLIANQLPDGPTTVYDIIELTEDIMVIEGEFNSDVNTITFDRTAG